MHIYVFVCFINVFELSISTFCTVISQTSEQQHFLQSLKFKTIIISATAHNQKDDCVDNFMPNSEKDNTYHSGCLKFSISHEFVTDNI